MPTPAPKPILHIRAPTKFAHVGSLRARETAHDPRSDSFEFNDVTIDLRDCQRIDTPAILWCLVYLSLTARRGANCALRLPTAAEPLYALTRSGANETLTAAGIRLDNRRPASVPSMPLPIYVMRSFSDVERAADRVLDQLASAPASIPSNLPPTVAETFVELANNGVEHSQSPIGTLGMVNLHEGKRKGNFEIAVADGGVGIPQTLKSAANSDRKRTWNDWSSIEYATGELISGTGDPHRGIGLFGVAEDSRHPGAALTIHSDNGAFHVNQLSEIRATRKPLFPGVLVYLSIQFLTA